MLTGSAYSPEGRIFALHDRQVQRGAAIDTVASGSRAMQPWLLGAAVVAGAPDVVVIGAGQVTPKL